MNVTWETVGGWTRVRDLREGELFVTQTAINRWRRTKGKRGTPLVLRRTDDPYISDVIQGGVIKRVSATSPSQLAVRVREKQKSSIITLK